MLFQDFIKIRKRRITADIALAVFKYADQAHIVIILWQIRLDVRKIPHMDRHVAAVLVAVGIDQAPLSGQIHARHTACLARQASRDRAAARAYLQHLHGLVHRQPFHDIFPQIGQGIKHLPAARLPDRLRIFLFRYFLHKLQKRILRCAVTVKILFRIMGIIQHHAADRFRSASFHVSKLLHFYFGFHIKIANRILRRNDRDV